MPSRYSGGLDLDRQQCQEWDFIMLVWNFIMPLQDDKDTVRGDTTEPSGCLSEARVPSSLIGFTFFLHVARYTMLFTLFSPSSVRQVTWSGFFILLIMWLLILLLMLVLSFFKRQDSQSTRLSFSDEYWSASCSGTLHILWVQCESNFLQSVIFTFPSDDDEWKFFRCAVFEEWGRGTCPRSALRFPLWKIVEE